MSIEWLFERMKNWKENQAIVWQDISFTYGEVLNWVSFWEKRLENEGIYKGEVIALEGDYSPKACSLLLALIKNKNIIVPITVATGAHKGEFIKTAEVQAIITLDGKDEYKIEQYQKRVSHPLILKLIKMGEPGLILFSSGSTGKSKAALHNFTRILEKYKVTRRCLRTITFLLFDHIGGINTLFYTLSNGGTVVFIQSRDPESVCKAIEKHKVELLPTSPTFLNLLLISEAYKRYDLSSLKLITYGTEVMPESTLKRIHEVFPNVTLQQTYGLSELGILRSKSKESNSPWVKIGGEGFEIKVVNGVLWIRAQSAMMGYLNAESPFDDDGWMNTQDLVEVDGEYIRILGRCSDLINVGGQKVYPAEVESVLMQMENIKDVSVHGEKNPIMGNIVVAKLVLKEPEDASLLKKKVWNFCKGKLESYKIPVKIEITDKIPYSERFKKLRS